MDRADYAAQADAICQGTAARAQAISKRANAKLKRISRSRAWGGDLVFFHETSSPSSYVYHVGIYEGGNHMVSAASASEGIRWQTIWSSDVTFGTITH